MALRHIFRSAYLNANRINYYICGMNKDFLKDLFGNKYNADNFFLLAGPCVVESEENVMQIAESAVKTCERLKIPYVFKASYRKANRTKATGFQGIGDEKALKIIAKVRDTFNVPVVTDIHLPEEAAIAAEYVDVLQIPAFLCRQTDLLLAAAATGKVVNIKKGQFLSPQVMRFPVEKVIGAGNNKVMLTDRGTMFGYHDLIVDMRAIPQMQEIGVPAILDCTHALQQPNQEAGFTGGDSSMIETLARAAIAVGADGLFMETHPDPANAKSDGPNMLRLDLLDGLMDRLVRLKQVVNSF